MRQDFYQPKTIETIKLDDRKQRFAALNRYITKRNGWITSIPGSKDVTMECLPGSTLPDDLRAKGYDVREDGEGQRILPTAIVEKFVTRADGQLEPLTDVSTKPIASVITHAGICKVKRYAFDMP